MGKRISFIIGAGASIDFSESLKTQSITDSIFDIGSHFDFPYYDKGEIIGFLVEIRKIIEDRGFQFDFEILFQFLTELETEYDKNTPQIINKKVPSFHSFSGCLSKEILDVSRGYILSCIFYQIRKERVKGFFVNGDKKWYESIFNTIQSKGFLLDIFTLNYDEYLDEVVDNINTGFTKSELSRFEDYLVFDEEYAHEYAEMNLLNHLHGSIRFNEFCPPGESVKKPMYEYNPPNETIGPLWNYSNQDMSLSVYSPIITGLDKINSLMHIPYRCYYSNFDNSLSTNDRLIIIGYGFRDYYVNALIDTFNRNPKKKILIISPDIPKKTMDYLGIRKGLEDFSRLHLVDKISWFKGTFKQASESNELSLFLDHFVR